MTMDHVAILSKSSGLLEKILSGRKKIESRWYASRFPPWDKISVGDTIYFKYSGGLVQAKARVKAVKQFPDLTPSKVSDLWYRYGKLIGIDDVEQWIKSSREKKYCILAYLEDVQRVRPFNINKKGFGNAAAWLLVEDINKIKMERQD